MSGSVTSCLKIAQQFRYLLWDMSESRGAEKSELGAGHVNGPETLVR